MKTKAWLLVLLLAIACKERKAEPWEARSEEPVIDREALWVELVEGLTKKGEQCQAELVNLYQWANAHQRPCESTGFFDPKARETEQPQGAAASKR